MNPVQAGKPAKPELEIVSVDSTHYLPRFTFKDTALTYQPDVNELRCNCIPAMRSSPNWMCNHILHVIRTRLDKVIPIDPKTTATILVPCSLPPNGKGETFFVKIVLDPEDDGTRQALWVNPSQPSQSLPIGLVPSGSEPLNNRLALRDIVWPYIIEDSLRVQCETCGIPASIEALDDVSKRTPTQRGLVVRDYLSILKWGQCAEHFDPDNVVPF